MKTMRVVLRALSSAFFLMSFSLLAAATPPPQQNHGPWIDSLTEPGERLDVKQASSQTGLPTFAATPGRGILLPVAPGASAEARAMAFVNAYGKAFGLSDASSVQLMRAPHSDDVGIDHVRLQQMHMGVPVRGGEFVVHLRGPRVVAANGHTIADLPFDVTPAFAPERAVRAARDMVAKYLAKSAAGAQYSEPRLEILNRTFLSGIGSDRSRLAWFIEATGPELREFIWIDAKRGVQLLHFSQLTDARSRQVYTAGNTSSLPGTLVRVEGGPATGDADSDNAYLLAGVTYDYFAGYHGRDSYDNAGAIIKSTTHYCPAASCPADYANAFWNGVQMVYGNGYSSADDVVAHELTHAVTERTAGLLYYMQSGALNESFSDIFGETVDLLSSTGGNDSPSVRWDLGEDIPGGAIRNMMNPNLYANPNRMSDSTYFVCAYNGWTDSTADKGGVHTNSGVPNHAYALMVDGGTFNFRTVTGIGLVKAAKVQYRALTTYLTSGSGFLDDYNALKQSCNDLIGTAGITANDCTQVDNALLATEMNLPWGCVGAVQAPALCTSGQVSLVAAEGFETGFGNWTATNTAFNTWSRDTDFSKSGLFAAYGMDGDPNHEGASSDHNLSMTNAVTLPAAAFLYFDHAYEFEFDPIFGTLFDGGVIEYSINGGTTWLDAGSLGPVGAAYDGVIDAQNGNPLPGRSAFTGSSLGYVGTRLSLAALAGQSFKFRFRIGIDAFGTSLGWEVDNVRIYRCVTPAPFSDDPLISASTRVKLLHMTELRNRINAVRANRGLGAYPFRSLSQGTSTILASDINEMRTALSQAYTVAGRMQPAYVDTSLSIVTRVRTFHIQELRTAVIAME